MPRVCTLCRHKRREEVDKAILAGESLRSIAGRFETSDSAVLRHRDHIPGRLAKAREAREVARADDLLAGIVTLRERLEKALQGAQAAKDVASLARELRETLRLMLELEGRLRQAAQVNILVNHPDVMAFRSRIRSVLVLFPDASRAVEAAFAADEGAPAGQESGTRITLLSTNHQREGTA